MTISKHIVLTGGTSGIGRELARRLYAGNRLVLFARASERLDSLLREMPGIRIVDVDLRDVAAVQAAAEALEAEGEPLDWLINNAAVQHTPTFCDPDFDIATIEEEIAVNLTIPAVLTAALLPALRRGRDPLILNINSGLALVPKKSSAVYCATKGGLDTLTQALRNQLEEQGISVKQVFLPLVETPMTEGRGSGKLTAQDAADRILAGIHGRVHDIDIGKTKLLRILTRATPALARKIMRKA